MPGISVVSPRSITWAAVAAGEGGAPPTAVMRLPVTTTSPGETTRPDSTSSMRAALRMVTGFTGSCWLSAAVHPNAQASSNEAGTNALFFVIRQA